MFDGVAQLHPAAQVVAIIMVGLIVLLVIYLMLRNM